MAEDHGELVGYAALWPSGPTAVVGRLVARDTAVAQALMEARTWPRRRTGRLRIDVEHRHTELLGLLADRGCEAGLPDDGDDVRHPLNCRATPHAGSAPLTPATG
ncbi:GNAT family N-acetyltransferase [Streptomyces californicus]